MSRFNQFTGFSGKSNVKGTNTPEGQVVFNAAQPIILSWVAQCRLQQKQSGLAYMRKYLNNAILKADWTWNNGGEILDVEIYSNAEVRELARPVLEQPKPAEPIEDKFNPEFEPPIPPEVLNKFEEIQLENGLIPLPPEVITCFVVLYNKTDCVVYDMRSLKKGLGNQKPLMENFKTQGDWTIPVEHVIVTRLRDYFGQAIWGGSNQNYWDYIRPYTLQMKNSAIMGPCAVATVSFSGGVFSYATGYAVYRLKSGLKTSQSIGGIHYIGQVGYNAGFPALNATDNMVYANAAQYTLTAEGTLALSSADAYGHNGDLASTYSVPSTPIIPRFIDETGEAHFDLAYNFGAHIPCMGERWLTGLFDAIPNDFKRALTVGPTSASSTAAYPVLTQENGIDILRAKILDIQSEFREGDLGGNTYYNYGSFPESAGAGPGVFTVPYPPSENDYTIAYNPSGGGTQLTSTFLSADMSGWDGRPIFGNGPEYDHMFHGFMQVSNGTYNLQGYAMNGTSYDTGTHLWPLDTYKFYLDGTDFTSTMESITGATAEDIDHAFMDVPLLSAQSIKKFTPP